VRFACGRLENLHEDERFDAVVGSSVLHHLDLEPALAKIRALLKTGGVLSFAEPNMLNPQVFFERYAGFLPMFSYV
jgi:SAM-dependent methyltransferase